VTKLTYEDWIDHRTGPRGDLDKIASGSMMVEAAAKRLLVRPDWETVAKVELDLATMTLAAALERLVRAQAIYQAKRIDE
jgi:hypothetical protein